MISTNTDTDRPAQGHSPGPWTATLAHVVSAAGIVATHAGDRSESLRYACEVGSEEATANGYVLAAAPDLLAALESLLFAARDGSVLHRDCAHKQARAAILKATRRGQ